jgi:Ca-activated chloride channel family protein
MAGELSLIVTLHRPVYQALPTPQQAYVLLEGTPTAAAPGTSAQPVNFSLVLDRSGSMAGEKLRQLKAAAASIVDRLGPQDLLSVVVFDDTADVIVPCGPVQDREAIQRRIASVDERGGTHMSTGMGAGLQELQQGLSPNRVNSMLLLTDGQTWEDTLQCENLADQCRASGIPINVLGLGVGPDSNWDPILLENLARRSGGEWAVIDSLEKVSAVFAKTLQAMQGTAVTNASLTMRLAEGITPRTVWRVLPLISRLDHQAVSLHDVQVFLGDIQHNVGQAVLADLLLPARPAGIYRLIQADITYDVPTSGLTRQKVTADVVLTFVDDPAQANQTNPRMMNIIERVVAHKLQTQALDEAAMGNAKKATQRLRAAATRLLELGENDLAQAANQQAQQIEEAGQIDPAAAQKMRYATKKLTESL